MDCIQMGEFCFLSLAFLITHYSLHCIYANVIGEIMFHLFLWLKSMLLPNGISHAIKLNIWIMAWMDSQERI
ncbi:hypothetical protein RJT34_32434 [Clitoria ternatea]|uniref:Uncharacterized protein n=1 Tax=Clitoria ternatea TaxID=43366 RepID=A0AAN9EY83_CLITE